MRQRGSREEKVGRSQESKEWHWKSREGVMTELAGDDDWSDDVDTQRTFVVK